MSEEETPQPKGFPLRPESLMFAGLGLSVVLVLLLTMRMRELERENEVLRQSYRGVVDIHNRSKSPCNCQEKEASQNGTTGLHSPASPGGVSTPSG